MVKIIIEFIKDVFWLLSDFSYYKKLVRSQKYSLVVFGLVMLLLYALTTGLYMSVKVFNTYSPIITKVAEQVNRIKIEDGLLKLEGAEQVEVYNKEEKILVKMLPDIDLAQARNNDEISVKDEIVEIKILFVSNGVRFESNRSGTYEMFYNKELPPINLSKDIIARANDSFFIFLIIISPLLYFIDGIVSYGFLVLFFGLTMWLMIAITGIPITKNELIGICIYLTAPGVIYPLIIMLAGWGNPYIASIVYVVFLWLVLDKFKPATRTVTK